MGWKNLRRVMNMNMKSRNLLYVFTVLIVLTLLFTGTYAMISYGEIQEITSDSNGDDQLSQIIEFDDSLYMIFSSTNPDITTGTDTDIVVKSYDGNSWKSPVELSSLDNDQADASPSSVVFNGNLYVAWSTNDMNDSTGNDWDIVFCYYDGTNWGEVQEVTDAGDTGDDYSPQFCVFSGKLYLAWQSWDNSTSDGDDADIIVRSFDGNVWSQIPKPMVGDLGNDYSPQLIVFGNEMYLIWTTDDKVANGTDFDIVARPFDGTQWNPVMELTSTEDTGDDQHPYACLHDGSLYVGWQTADDNTGTGKDDDIVLRWYDGSTWSDILELTSSEILGHKDTGSDAFPYLTSFDGQLHLLWQSNDPITTNGSDFDIVICSYNGDKWSKVMELTPTGDAGRDGGVFMRGLETWVYHDDMYIFWQTTDSETSSGGDLDIVMIKSTPDVDNGHEPDDVDNANDLILLFGVVCVCIVVTIGYLMFTKQRKK